MPVTLMGQFANSPISALHATGYAGACAWTLEPTTLSGVVRCLGHFICDVRKESTLITAMLLPGSMALSSIGFLSCLAGALQIYSDDFLKTLIKQGAVVSCFVKELTWFASGLKTSLLRCISVLSKTPQSRALFGKAAVLLLVMTGNVYASHRAILESDTGILEKPIWNCSSMLGPFFHVHVTAEECATIRASELTNGLSTNRRCTPDSWSIVQVGSFPGVVLTPEGELAPATLYSGRAITWLSCVFPGGKPFLFGEEAQANFAVLLDKKLTIKITPADKEPESSTNLLSVEPRAAAALTAKVYDQNNQLVPNVNVRFEASAVPRSGGHDHDDSTRPKGGLGGPKTAPHIVTGNTGGTGFVFNFTADEVAGDHKITAKCTEGKTCTQTGADTVWVGVKDLKLIPDSTVYKKIEPNADQMHPSNHYLSFQARIQLTYLAALYRVAFPDDSVLHLNDASLVRGGLFDLPPKYPAWNPPHKGHKRGVLIDIQANGTLTAIPQRNFKEFEKLAAELKMSLWPEQLNESNGHYHVRLLGIEQ